MRSPIRPLSPLLLSLLFGLGLAGGPRPLTAENPSVSEAERQAPGADRTERTFAYSFLGVATVRGTEGTGSETRLAADFHPTTARGEVLRDVSILLSAIAGWPADAEPQVGAELPLEVTHSFFQVGSQTPRLVQVGWRHEPAAKFQPRVVVVELRGNYAGKNLHLEANRKVLASGLQHLLPPGQSDRHSPVAEKPFLPLKIQLNENTLYDGDLPLFDAVRILLIFRDDKVEIVRSKDASPSSD